MVSNGKPDGRSPLTPLSDKTLHPDFHRLYRVILVGRWVFVGFLWCIVGGLSLWGLRREIGLLQDYFTWAAVRYGLMFNRWPALGLFFCIGFTASTLVWQLRNHWMGLPRRSQHRLEEQAKYIRKTGRSHPLWRWVCQDHPEFPGQ